MATRPSSHRQRQTIFPTPLIGDLLFTERVVVQTRTHPAYGTPHPNTAAWPHHELVFVKERVEETDSQDTFDYFYAAERSTQDLYNWTHAEADIGGTKFDAISRDYVIKREDFNPNSPLQGASMADIPVGKFTGTHVLAERSAIRSQEKELDSLYVFERRTYVKKVPLIDIEINRETGDAQQIINTLYYRGEIVTGTSTIESLVADQTNAFWDLDGNGFGNVVKQLSENWWEVSQRQWINLYDIWEWELDRRGPKEYYCPPEETTTTETTTGNTPGPYTPLPTVPIGQMVKIIKWGSYMRYTTVTRSGVLTGSTGEEYGDIVTKSVTKELVGEGTPADTGIDIISSVVEQLECDIYLKTTKEAKDGWPEPLARDVTKDGSYLPPQRYRKDLTRTNVSRKIDANAIPANPTLGSGEIAKTYKKETPDRAEETVTSEVFTLDTSTVDESIEQKPFISILSRMTPAPVPVLPVNRNGSSKLVYEGTDTDIYENIEEIATARPGPAGLDKDTKPFVTIQTDKRYSASPDISTISGAANLLFNDGTTQVYEVSEINSTGRYGDAGAEQQVKPFVKITSDKEYTPTGILPDGAVGNSNKIYDDGQTVVYEQSIETAQAREGPAGRDKDVKAFISLLTEKRYSASPDINTNTGSAGVVFNDGNTQVYEVSEVYPTARTGLKGIETDAQQWGKIESTTNYTTSDEAPAGGSVRIIYDDGDIKVYETTTTAPEAGGTNIDIDPQNWGLIRWDGVYATTPSGAKSRQVWSNGEVSVYLNETPTLTISGTNKDIEAQNWGSITWNGIYAAVSGGVKSRQVYSGPGGPVFLNETPEVTFGGTNVDLDIFPWGAVKWNGVFQDSFNEAADRSKQVYRIGEITIFLNETAELIVNSVEFISKKESNAILTQTERTSYGLSPTFEGNGSSSVVYGLKDQKVYENTSITREAKASKTYAGLTNVSLPPIWQGYISDNIKRRDGADFTLFTPYVSAGYSGPMVCEIEEFWTEDPSAGGIQPTIMLPTPMDFNTPVGSFSVPACLHGQVSIPWGTGTQHKIFEYNANTITYPATTPPTYVGMKIIAGVSTSPYLDGYVVRIYRVQL